MTNTRINSLLKRAKESGTPLIDDDPTNENNKIVTFIIENDSKSKEDFYIVWDYKRYWDIPITESDHFTQSENENIYTLSVSLPKDLQTVYSFYKKPANVDIGDLTDKVILERTSKNVEKERQCISGFLRNELEKTGFYKDPLNSHLYTCNPDKNEGYRQSILTMPDAKKNTFAPNSPEEADKKLTTLTTNNKFFERKIDLSKTGLSFRFNYINFIEDNPPFEQVMQWQRNNITSGNILLVKTNDGYGIFSARFGSPIRGELSDTLKNIDQNIFENKTELEESKMNIIKNQVNSFLNNRSYYTHCTSRCEILTPSLQEV